MDKHQGSKDKHGSKTSHSLNSQEMDESSDISSYGGSSLFISPEVNRALSNVTHGSQVKVHFASAPEDVNLDKLFGFEKARRMAGKFKPEEKDEPLPDTGVVPHRIFINHVDDFFCHYLVEYLSTQLYSFPKEEGEEESSVEEKSSGEETDEEEEELSEREEDLGDEVVNLMSSEETKDRIPMKLPEDGGGDAEEEEKEYFGDFDEDPFACLLEEEESEASEEELDMVDKLFPVDRSDLDQHHITDMNVGNIDLRKLKPEEYFELLDIASEESRVRYLRSIVHKKHRQKARKRAEKEEERRLKEAQKKMKYSKTHRPFEIYGTLYRDSSTIEKEDSKYKYLENVHIIRNMSEDRDAYLDIVMTCGTVLFNLTHYRPNDAELAKWTVQAMTRRLQDKELQDREAFKKSLAMRSFILISPMLTWANTERLDLETTSDLTEMAFIETEFRRRNPHENSIKMYRAENEVLNCGQKYRGKFKTLVINAGVLYGHEQKVLDFLFVHTWKSEMDTPLLTTGDNLIPLIHVTTLSEIVYKCIRRAPFIKPPLFFAMERKCLTLNEICETIAIMFGNGNVTRVKKDSSLIYPEPSIDQVAYDYLTANLKVTPRYLIDTLDPRFNDHFVENRKLVEAEYIEANGLEPLQIFIDGPPLSGKTRLAIKLCQHYNIHLLNHDTMVELYRERFIAREKDLKFKLRERLKEEAQNETDQNYEEDESPEAEEIKIIQGKLSDLKKTLYEGNGHIADETVMQNILSELLTFKRITNIGYVLDGWPSTYETMNKAFDGKDNLAPNIFIKLDLDETQCLDRIYNVSEEYLKNNPVDETTLIDRMFAYRNMNRNENSTVTSFFKEREPWVKIFEINANEDINFFRLSHNIGKPRDRKFWIKIIGIDADNVQEDMKDSDESKIEDEDAREKKLKAFAEEQIQRRIKANENEQKILAVYAERLRKYAQSYLMPTLLKGLLETSRTEPPNPIDFLAEYLFRHNPEGKVLTELQRQKFGPEHITVSDQESFRQLQENLAKSTKHLNKTTKY